MNEQIKGGVEEDDEDVGGRDKSIYEKEPIGACLLSHDSQARNLSKVC